MIKIDCTRCKKDCCGKIKSLRPVLLPNEEKKFREKCDIIETPFRKMLVLKRKNDGHCIFFDEGRCTIYSKRPLECKLYPFLLDLSKEKTTARLDRRFCSSLKTLKYDKKELIYFFKDIKPQKEWIKAYRSMIDY